MSDLSVRLSARGLVPPVGISSHGVLSDSPDAVMAGPLGLHLVACCHISGMALSLSTGLFLGCFPVACPSPPCCSVLTPW